MIFYPNLFCINHKNVLDYCLNFEKCRLQNNKEVIQEFFKNFSWYYSFNYKSKSLNILIM